MKTLGPALRLSVPAEDSGRSISNDGLITLIVFQGVADAYD